MILHLISSLLICMQQREKRVSYRKPCSASCCLSLIEGPYPYPQNGWYKCRNIAHCSFSCISKVESIVPHIECEKKYYCISTLMTMDSDLRKYSVEKLGKLGIYNGQFRESRLQVNMKLSVKKRDILHPVSDKRDKDQKTGLSHN